MKKKICIIGCGEMGKRHAKDMDEFSEGRIEVAGVFDPDDKSYEIGCEWTGKRPMRFDSIKTMIDTISPDGVIIASPNSHHLSCLREFTGLKIPLILEKPLDTDMDKVVEIVRFVEKYQAPVMVHHVMRYSPIVLKAKELMDAGELGELCSFEMVQNGAGGMFHNFRRTFKTGGGQLLEKATHDFDVLLFLTGMRPSRVAAICKRQYYGGTKPNTLRCRECNESQTCHHAVVKPSSVNDTVSRNDLCVFSSEINIFDNETCMIELENGIFGTYSECFFSNAPFTRRYEFSGKNGFLSIDFSAGTLLLNSSKKGSRTFEFDYNQRIHYNGAPGVAKHFYDLMSNHNLKVHSPVKEAFIAELISFAAYNANSEKRFVDIAELVTPDFKNILD
ncbi:MAG: Gfo/Idh/MocA family oxidoreductase [Lentisphaerota bacterium]